MANLTPEQALEQAKAAGEVAKQAARQATDAAAQAQGLIDQISASATSLAHATGAAAISAPTTITEEIALVTAISGVCSAGVTDQTT